MGERRMRAYWYGFDETGENYIDDVLSAVAVAGKRFHNTEEWGGSGWEADEGVDSCEQSIQKTANAAAKDVADLRRQLEGAKAELLQQAENYREMDKRDRWMRSAGHAINACNHLEERLCQIRSIAADVSMQKDKALSKIFTLALEEGYRGD